MTTSPSSNSCTRRHRLNAGRWRSIILALNSALRDDMFEDQKSRLLGALDEMHTKYCQAKESDWPSLYFHLSSLEAARAGNLERFAECAYAMLVAFRMNSNNAKMRRFAEFRSSLRLIWPKALQLQEKTPDSLNGYDWGSLREVFWRIRSMDSGTSLVGNSKVMAHLIPNLVPPVDRRYTLSFLFGSSEITNGLDAEWKMLEQILRRFFYPIAQTERFREKTKEWLTSSDRFRWDTSPLKIVDNLVMELFRCHKCGKTGASITYHSATSEYLCPACRPRSV